MDRDENVNYLLTRSQPLINEKIAGKRTIDPQLASYSTV